MSLAERIKAEVPLREVVGRVVDWDMRESAPARGDWWACCPFHAEKTPSFHVFEPKGVGGFFRCFGCGAKGTVIDFVMQHEGAPIAEALERLRSRHGLAIEESPAARRAREMETARRQAEAAAAAEEKAARNLARAQTIWAEARPGARGGLLWRYLEARGIDPAVLGGIPPTLRVHPSLPYHAQPRGGGRVRLQHRGPAMVGRIGRRGNMVGVHRTWITRDGRAHLADGRKAQKRWLGRTGHIKGRPVVLAAPAAGVLAGEGIETTLAALAACRAAGDTAWSAEAALSRDALAEDWEPIPLAEDGPGRVIVLGEGSTKNPALAEAKARQAADRLAALGFAAEVRVPHGRWDHDDDFADLAQRAARAAIVEDSAA